MTSDLHSLVVNILSDPSEASTLEPQLLDLVLQLGAIQLIEFENLPGGSAALAESVARHPNLLVREAAYAALLRLAPKDAKFANALYVLALEYDYLPARQHLQAGLELPDSSALKAILEWQITLDTDRSIDLPLVTSAVLDEASPRLQERVLAAASKAPRYKRWGQMLEYLIAGDQKGFSLLVEQYPVLTDQERLICRSRLYKLAASNDFAREALIQLFVQHEDKEALALIQSAGWLPQSIPTLAMFFFLSGQTEHLKEVDFDGTVLVTAYETASKSLRRRLLTYSRQTGQIEWLRTVSRTADVRYLSDLGDADWETILSRFVTSERFLDLWRLAQSAPPRWCAAILTRLAQTSWQPPSPPEQEIYQRLVPLAQTCWESPLDLKPVHSFKAPSENITCLAIGPRNNILAGGSTTQTIFLWDLPRGVLHVPSLSGPAPVTRALSFSPDGEFLVAAGGDQRIRLFRHHSAQIVKTIEGHHGLVRSIAVHPDGRTLVSAGFDGTLRTWRFPLGTRLHHLISDIRENFAVAVLAEQDMLISAGSGWNISVWKLSDGTLLRRIPSGSDGILHLAPARTSELVASAGRDRALSVWNARTGLLVRRFSLHPSAIVGLAFFPGDQVLVTAGQGGRLYLWNLSSDDPLAILETGEATLTAMAMSPDGQNLVTASDNGTLAVWNFASFLWTIRSAAPGQPMPVEALEDRLKLPNLSSSEKRWLEFTSALWHWARRYDIELGEPSMLTFEDFDIEL